MFRQILHSIIAVLLWFIFAYYWTIVFRRPMNPDTKTALIALSVLTLVSAVCLVVWVFHNIRVFRTVQHRRRHRREASEPDRDYLGRRMVMENLDVLKRSNHVEVGVVRDRSGTTVIEAKVFRSVDRTRYDND